MLLCRGNGIEPVQTTPRRVKKTEENLSPGSFIAQVWYAWNFSFLYPKVYLLLGMAQISIYWVVHHAVVRPARVAARLPT